MNDTPRGARLGAPLGDLAAADPSATALGKAPMSSVPVSPVALGKAPMRDGSVPVSPVALGKARMGSGLELCPGGESTIQDLTPSWIQVSPVALGKAPMRDGSVPVSPVARHREG